MTGRVLAGVAAGIVVMLVGCAGALGVFLTGGIGDGSATAAAAGCDQTIPGTATAPVGAAARGSFPAVGRWNPTQVANAAIIIDTGAQLRVPIRGWVIAVATAMQESSLHNYGNLGARNDHDSLGLFQQRPSQGWGTPAQILNRVHAATSFYRHLLAVHGWQRMPLTRAAQAVQRSAFPDAYAKWEQPATGLVAAVTGQPSTAIACHSTSPAWTSPLPGGAVTAGYHTSSGADHDGIDIAAPAGTPIHAAAAGTVTAVGCQAHTADGAPVDCDTDGNPHLSGLGWYLTISHPGGTTTSYGHQLIHPTVDLDDTVTTGELIGLVGSSGQSTASHLYFQVTVAGHPVDPAQFLADQGAPLSSPPPSTR